MHEGCREPTDGDSAEAMGRLASGCASSIRLGRLLGCRQDALARFVTPLTAPLSPGAEDATLLPTTEAEDERLFASWDCASQRLPGQLCGIRALADLSRFCTARGGGENADGSRLGLLSVPPSVLPNSGAAIGAE
ncbi:hypothetical protein IscW_ISCW023219 [Ixodes scapularis]|uniref:Uncharacterized protein n=1 Tax=Ixodes scapularis TaxID=6945 RepID=B7QJA2_IXOSC|nr:hypothetical protein IscW_ISCW023219 [Ixodes scapularis]|eukprot:XP_002415259.1 hypothetical protein IscW_ISCW023219 [Ixodes scapularis]